MGSKGIVSDQMDPERRWFLQTTSGFLLGLVGATMPLFAHATNGRQSAKSVTLFLSGDVMTARGIDQVLPHPGDPRLPEGEIRDARHYVELAERVNGPIPKPVDFDYIWGDGLGVLDEIGPDARIINLETSVTTASDHYPEMGIYYRMHPQNVPVLTAAGVDVAVLSNNHVMNFKRPGLTETLDTLQAAGIRTAGAGQDLKAAQAPAVIPLPGGGRILVYGIAERNSGIPRDWAAKPGRSGLNDFQGLHGEHADRFIEHVHSQREPGDRVIVSIHWGGNWGYEIPIAQRNFAHRLIDEAGADVVHGHSSHHVKGIEVWNERPILYGCGDLISDYEGIAHGREFRGDLVLMYLVTLNAKTGALERLEMAPMRVRRFRLQHASSQEADWLREVMNRECGELGGRVELTPKRRLRLGWSRRPA